MSGNRQCTRSITGWPRDRWAGDKALVDRAAGGGSGGRGCVADTLVGQGTDGADQGEVALRSSMPHREAQSDPIGVGRADAGAPVVGRPQAAKTEQVPMWRLAGSHGGYC